MRYNVFDPERPTRQLLDRIAGKWTVLVIGALRDGPLHFGELRRAVGGVAPKVPTSALRSLERDGVIRRRVHTASPLRVEYSLTPLGRSLAGAVAGLSRWAERQMDKVLAARQVYEDTRRRGA